MSAWFSGLGLLHLVEFVIGLTLLEGLALVLYQRATGRGPAPNDFLLNLISGLFLMLALHSALSQSSWVLTAFWMSASGLTHWSDLARRWTRRRR